MKRKKWLSILLTLCLTLTLVPTSALASEAEPEPTHEHSYTATETVEPTCEDGGYTVYSYKCGDNYKECSDPLYERLDGLLPGQAE